jgi:steroid 5-alpha reductase family enzyme
MDDWGAPLWALLFACALMLLIWLLARRLHNAGIVDVAWAAGFTPVALLYAPTGSGMTLRRALLASMVGVWSLRLASYLYVRVRALHPREDRRYARLRSQWGAHADARMLGFFQLQALLLVLLSVPFWLICLNPRPSLAPLEWAGVVTWLLAVSGESAADRQLKRFKADPANRGAVCAVGLWRYSRHPNYFFEWLVWVAYFLMALAAPRGWLTVYCPALMLYFLLRVTGIPLTEQLSLEAKGTAYRDYQRRTSMFVPWFPKTMPTGES